MKPIKIIKFNLKVNNPLYVVTIPMIPYKKTQRDWNQNAGTEMKILWKKVHQSSLEIMGNKNYVSSITVRGKQGLNRQLSDEEHVSF